MARGPVALVKAGQALLWCHSDMVERREREAEWFMCCWVGKNWREGQQLCVWSYCHMRPCEVWAKLPVRQSRSQALLQLGSGLMFIVPINHQKPGGCLWSALPPEAMLLPEGHAVLASPLTWSERVGPTFHQPTTTQWHPAVAWTGAGGGRYIRTIAIGAPRVWATARFLRSLSEDPILMV